MIAHYHFIATERKK